jgi:hypothetical protein
VTSVVYDAAILIAADRNVRPVWADHRARLELGIVPLVPAGVVAQVSRSRKQAQLRRFLRGCSVAAFDEASAHRAGQVLAKAGTPDVVDASVVVLAELHEAMILTGAPDDIIRLCRAADARLVVVPV